MRTRVGPPSSVRSRIVRIQPVGDLPSFRPWPLQFKMRWAGDPRVNIQNNKGKAKAYPVRQVLAAIDKKEAM